MRKMLQARERVKSNHDDDENVESLDTARSFATKTPEGREQVREFVNQWPTYASAYFKLLSTGEWDEHEKGELDRIYGPKVQRSGLRWRRLTKDADVSTLPRVVSPSM
ncbi:unnamed protein product, partial [Nesidiocoris tenuis]